MQKIKPFLWFDDNAEEAIDYYISVFKNAKITDIGRYSEAGPRPAGSVMTIAFELEGMAFIALNGGPHFEFSPAISFMVDCETQEELDRLWDKLLEGGGTTMQCGWLTDRFGVSWQIVPSGLNAWLQDADPMKARRVAEAMYRMVKLDIAALERAHIGP